MGEEKKNLRKDLETIKKKCQVEITGQKGRRSEKLKKKKNSLDGINNILDATKESINGPEDGAIEIIQFEAQRGKKDLKE